MSSFRLSQCAALSVLGLGLLLAGASAGAHEPGPVTQSRAKVQAKAKAHAARAPARVQDEAEAAHALHHHDAPRVVRPGVYMAVPSHYVYEGYGYGPAVVYELPLPNTIYRGPTTEYSTAPGYYRPAVVPFGGR